MNATTTKPVAEPYSKKVGENFLDWINQEDRLCTVLLNTGDRVLAEYIMPAGSTALRLYRKGKSCRSISYRTVPSSMLQILVDEGVQWMAQPQHTWNAQVFNTPATLLASRAQPVATTEPVEITYSVGAKYHTARCENCDEGLPKHYYGPLTLDAANQLAAWLIFCNFDEVTVQAQS